MSVPLPPTDVRTSQCGEALAVARRWLGQQSRLVQWIEADVTSTPLPERFFDVWHDRAVFHFLTDETDRRAYVDQVMRTVKPGGHVIVVTFAPDGPAECSGLPVVQYDADSLHGEFGWSNTTKKRTSRRQGASSISSIATALNRIESTLSSPSGGHESMQ
jgi:ubiquinone/menaquinone biosynthesis C-methylase UbiE